MSESIPKRIVQTGKSSDLRPRDAASAAGLQSLNPDFDYAFFDDSAVTSFIDRQDSVYREAFRSFPFPIQRFDFFRYLAIYESGGFYFDLDVFLGRPLAPLLSQRCVFSFEELTLNRYLWEKHGLAFEIGNYAFGSVPRHPFLKAVIDNCVRALRDPAWVRPMLVAVPRLFRSDYAVFNTTGPGLLTRTLAENPHLTRDVTILMPSDPGNQAHWHNFGTYGIHLMEHTWRGTPHPVRKRLFALWRRRSDRRMREEIAARGTLMPPDHTFCCA